LSAQSLTITSKVGFETIFFLLYQLWFIAQKNIGRIQLNSPEYGMLSRCKTPNFE